LKPKTSNTKKYISIREVPDVFIAKLNSQGIIEVDLSNKSDEIDKQALVLLIEIVKELGNGKKMPVYIKANDFLGITSEARNFAALPESGEFTIANAVLISSLANKMLLNFFLKINKPIVPTKGFTSEEDAFEWLLSFK
jgi:hypothetical protein